ncbi:putative BRCT domain, microcephalin, BRCT domain superfamily [Plasmopara halstedii]
MPSFFRTNFIFSVHVFRFAPKAPLSNLPNISRNHFIIFSSMVTTVSNSRSLAKRASRETTSASSIVTTKSTTSGVRKSRNIGPLKGVVAMVDVRVGIDAEIDCSDIVSQKLRELGASTVKRLTPKLTHIVLSHFTPTWKNKIAKWQASGVNVAAFAARYSLKIVSQLWVNACYVSKTHMDERPFFPVGRIISFESSPSTGNQKGLKGVIRKKTGTTQVYDFKNCKVANGNKRKRAVSMEPMNSNVMMEKLDITIKVAKLDKHKGVSLSAKRRKTLNGPLTQQDEDEVTVSQASGSKFESKSDHEDKGKMKMNENVMKIDIPKINLSAASNSYTTGSGNKTRKRARPGALDDSMTSRVVRVKRQDGLREAFYDKRTRSFSIQGESHREVSLAMCPREYQNRPTSNFAKRGSALQRDETHDRRGA